MAHEMAQGVDLGCLWLCHDESTTILCNLWPVCGDDGKG